MEDKKRSPVELGKNVLILLLSCSAIYLAGKTYFAIGGVTGEQLESSLSGQIENQARGSLVWPVRLALSSWEDESMMRYGVQYDREDCDLRFQQVANLLREALSGLGEAEAVSRDQWRRALSGTSNIYFDLMGELPISLVSEWLTGEDSQREGTVRRMVLSDEGDRVALYYRNEDDGTYYASHAGLVTPEQLEAAVRGVTDNGASFAFELEQYGGLHGDTMLLPKEPSPRIYAAVNPLAEEREMIYMDPEGNLANLLEALSFPANSYTYSGVDQVFLSGNDVLRISDSGSVRYTAAEDGHSRYLIPAGAEGPNLSQIAEACRRLASGALEPLCGEARLCLRKVTQEEGIWRLDFGYCLDGAEVQVGEQGFAARFYVEGSEITHFTMQLRSYTDTGSRSIVLPEMQAMAAMSPLGKWGSELELVYYDAGGDTVSAGWTAE